MYSQELVGGPPKRATGFHGAPAPEETLVEPGRCGGGSTTGGGPQAGTLPVTYFHASFRDTTSTELCVKLWGFSRATHRQVFPDQSGGG